MPTTPIADFTADIIHVADNGDDNGVSQPALADSYANSSTVAGQLGCSIPVRHSLWNSTMPNGGLIPNLWGIVESQLKILLAARCYNPGEVIKIVVGYTPTTSSGFALHGIQLYFSGGMEAGLGLTFIVAKDGQLKLTEAEYRFTKPALAAANLRLNPSLSDILGEILGGLNKEAILKLAREAIIEKYNKDDAGKLVKPTIIAFDSIKVVLERGGRSPAIYLELKNEVYLKRAWGGYTFASDEKKCYEKVGGGPPGEFLEDMFGSDACRNIRLGDVVRHAVLKWILT